MYEIIETSISGEVNKISSSVSFNELEFNELASAKDEAIKEKIMNKFFESREERIKLLREDQAKEIEKRIFLQARF